MPKITRAPLARVTLLWALCGLGLPAAAAPTDAAASRAEALNQTVPGLEARAHTAASDAANREAYFAWKCSFVDAFYALSSRDLNDPAVVAGLRAELDDRAARRAAERVAPLPDLGDARAVQRLAQASDRALDAEDRADGLQRRLLVAVAEHLARFHQLTTAGLTAQRAPARSILSTPLPADPAQAQAQARKAAQADEDLALLAALVEGLRDRALVRGAALPSPDADLARLLEPDRADAAASRLLLLRPFLDGDSATGCTEALVAWLQGRELPAETAARDAAKQALA